MEEIQTFKARVTYKNCFMCLSLTFLINLFKYLRCVMHLVYRDE